LKEQHKEYLELCHFMLFFFGTSFVALAILEHWCIAWEKRKWDRYSGVLANSSGESPADLALDFEHCLEVQRRVDSGEKPQYDDRSDMRRLRKLRRRIEFVVHREDFVKRNAVPHDFDFAKYLRKSATYTLIELLEVGLVGWAFAVLTVGTLGGIYYLLSETLGKAVVLQYHLGLWIFMLAEWALVVIYVLLLSYLTHFYKRVTASIVGIKDGGDYDDALLLQKYEFVAMTHGRDWETVQQV